MNQTDHHDNPINETSTSNDVALGVAFVQARWHGEIVDKCREGFLAEMARNGVNIELVDVFDVPGSFDIPLLVKKLALTGRYEAIVAAGFVVDGGIYRHDFVAKTVVEALMGVQMETGVPVLSAVLTPHHFHEHAPHSEFFMKHFITKGREAARACLQITSAIRSLTRPDRRESMTAGFNPPAPPALRAPSA